MTTKRKGKTPLQTRKEMNEDFLHMLEESVPTSQNERRKYVADIAFFYATVFQKKLKHFIGLQLEELAQIGRSELGNDIIRSNINCFRLIDEWMQKKTNEHAGNMQDIRNSFSNEKDFIKEIKKTYGNL